MMKPFSLTFNIQYMTIAIQQAHFAQVFSKHIYGTLVFEGKGVTNFRNARFSLFSFPGCYMALSFDFIPFASAKLLSFTASWTASYRLSSARML